MRRELYRMAGALSSAFTLALAFAYTVVRVDLFTLSYMKSNGTLSEESGQRSETHCPRPVSVYVLHSSVCIF